MYIKLLEQWTCLWVCRENNKCAHSLCSCAKSQTAQEVTFFYEYPTDISIV